MKSEIVVICEGSVDATFVRTFLRKRGYKRNVHFLSYPQGKGCGEQFVRKNYPVELKALRRWKNKGLLVMLDADAGSVENRMRQLDEACDSVGVERRRNQEPVAFIVPKRNVETWLVYLHGGVWGEEEDYKKSVNDDLAKGAARKLHDMCYKDQKLLEPAPDSLKKSCDEWRRVR